MMMQRQFLALLALLLLVGCATQNFNEGLAAAHSTNNGVLSSAKTLLDGGKIHSSDGQNVLDQTAVAFKGLEVARALNKTDPKAAAAKLSSTRAILNELKSYLLLKERK